MTPAVPCTELGCTTSIEVIAERLPLNHQRLIDIGCGNMAFSRLLLEHGAHVLAIDPDPIQAKLNRTDEFTPRLDFIEAGAEQLPVADQSADGLCFCFSLHHVAARLYPIVFDEIFRVLKPTGFLCVIEPMDCPLNKVMSQFHNEDQERWQAQQALHDFAVPRFESSEIFLYHSFTQYRSFEQFASHFNRRSFNQDYNAEDVNHPQVRETFERLGQPDYRFKSPKQAMILKRPIEQN